ncbi:MAG: SLC13 family permease [Syntrophomonadaceae bacterium]|nr:SLC13 family permease [Syntrophomonadaceae bacterium]
MDSQLIICLVVFGAVLAGFFANKWPIALTAMVGSLLMVVTGCLEPASAVAPLSSGTAVQLASLFILSGAFSKTRVIVTIANKVAAVAKGSLLRVVAGYVLVAFILNEFVGSAVATFTILYPLISASCKQMNMSPSKVMFPVGIVCICCGATTPAGSVAMMSILNGYLETYGMSQFANFPILTWTWARLPATLVMLGYAAFFCARRLPERIPADALKTDASANTGIAAKKLTTLQERVSVIVFALVILGLMFNSLINRVIPIAGWQLCLFGAVTVVAFGSLRGKELWCNMGLNMVFLYVGTTGIGTAMSNCGAAQLVGDLLSSMFGGTPNSYLVGFVFFIIPFLLTQVMSNAAVNFVFSPITIMCMNSMGANPLGPCFLVIIAALSSFMTPMATACVPVMMEAGGYTQKDLVKISIVPSLIVCVVSVLWIMTIFPLYG